MADRGTASYGDHEQHSVRPRRITRCSSSLPRVPYAPALRAMPSTSRVRIVLQMRSFSSLTASHVELYLRRRSCLAPPSTGLLPLSEQLLPPTSSIQLLRTYWRNHGHLRSRPCLPGTTIIKQQRLAHKNLQPDCHADAQATHIHGRRFRGDHFCASVSIVIVLWLSSHADAEGG